MTVRRHGEQACSIDPWCAARDYLFAAASLSGYVQASVHGDASYAYGIIPR